jgi:hypothetical protein
MPTLRKYWTAQIGVNHCHVDFRVYLCFELFVGDSRRKVCTLPLAACQLSIFSILMFVSGSASGFQYITGTSE